ncbi:MAG: YkgJ family cysteine cluster protein [Ferruginibacter sp.]|nr:YkgJ family cysteine cluster protein [Ferruginibacter sp.]
MQAVNLRSFKQKVRFNKVRLKKFLSKVLKEQPRGLDKLAADTEKEVWKEVDCLTCANCCKTMSPTFNAADIKRISKHFNQSPEAFTKQWLRKDKIGDMLNKTEPCQFLNLQDNKCSIYEIRPADCSGFPHLSKKRMVDYIHVHKQNIEYCPATYKLVEKMQALSKN